MSDETRARLSKLAENALDKGGAGFDINGLATLQLACTPDVILGLLSRLEALEAAARKVVKASKLRPIYGTYDDILTAADRAVNALRDAVEELDEISGASGE